MHDLHCKEADKMYSNVLSARVQQLKETTEGVNQMCQELEEIYNEGEQSGELKKQEKLPLLFLIWECLSRTNCKSCKSLY